MANAEFANLANPRKVVSALKGVVDPIAIAAIEREIGHQAQAMFNLSLKHFRIAKRLNAPDWRQKVSRSYYASYSCSKLLRYYVEGTNSKDVGDHKKVGNLPDDFPNRAFYSNKLTIMREDRNLCDYDHIAKAKDLSIGVGGTITLSRDFIHEVKVYVSGRGLVLVGNI